MSPKTSRHVARLVPALIGTALVATSLAPAASAGDPLHCEIQVTEHASSIALDAVVLSSTAASGTYEFSVSGGSGDGNSDIAQSGEFSVAAGSESSVGQVTLGNNGTYVARLAVTSGSSTHRCTKRIAGSL